MAGAIARQALASSTIYIKATITNLGGIANPSPDDIERLTGAARARGNTLGGIIECRITGAPAGLGQPLYGKLSAMLSSAMMSINAVKGVEIGLGFEYASASGPEANDPFTLSPDGKITTVTNNCGGILGGISTGGDIIVKVALKPIATCPVATDTVNDRGETVTITPHGRHDVTALTRAVPVVEAMTSCVMLDALLMNRTSRL